VERTGLPPGLGATLDVAAEIASKGFVRMQARVASVVFDAPHPSRVDRVNLIVEISGQCVAVGDLAQDHSPVVFLLLSGVHRKAEHIP
jgi:hypothetical protein